MKTMRVVIWKEGHAFLRDRLRLVALSFFPLFFGTYFAARYGRMLFVPTALLPMLAGAYSWSQAAFQKEVSDKTLPNLLASPMTPRTLLLGKSLAVFLFSYALELIGVAVCVGFSWFRLGELPTLASVYTALVVIPIWGFVLIELFGVIFSLVRSGVGVWLLTTPFYVAVLLSTLSPEASTVVDIVLSSLWLPPVAGLGIAALLYALMGRISKDRMTRVAS
jgi:ABC-type transport system involved in multi-copper enzyme maturation permease subunit